VSSLSRHFETKNDKDEFIDELSLRSYNCLEIHYKKRQVMKRKDGHPVSIRLTDEEYQLLLQAAEDDNRAIANYVKLLVLNSIRPEITPREKSKIQLCADMISDLISMKLQQSHPNVQAM